MKSKGNFINGIWKQGSGDRLVSFSPNNNQPIWEGYSSTSEDINTCVSLAIKALPVWSNMDVEQRITYLQKYVEIVKENAEHLAEVISIEIGKPLWESKTEVSAIIGKLTPSISAYNLRNAERINELAYGISKTHFKPIGVVAVIGPYNFPGHMANGHIIPALISGNTVIFKPSEKGALTAEFLMKLWEKAELPKGVINMLQGDANTGELLVSHNGINGVFFTGSYSVGSKIQRICGTNKMCALEMGGNSPLVVWDSEDIDAAVLSTIQSAFITAGQRCSAARRVIIPNNIFGNKFADRLVEISRNIRVGQYTDNPEPFFGPLRSKEMVDAVLREQETLLSQGGISMLKSIRMSMGDCFVSPGIIDITNISEKQDNELIAPFIKIIRVNTFNEAIDEANNTEYGLAAGIITEDKTLYQKFSTNVHAGLINWNQQLTGAVGTAPFGGIKKSGNYRPSGYFAVDYCVYAVASIEVEKLKKPDKLPEGIIF